MPDNAVQDPHTHTVNDVCSVCMCVSEGNDVLRLSQVFRALILNE